MTPAAVLLASEEVTRSVVARWARVLDLPVSVEVRASGHGLRGGAPPLALAYIHLPVGEAVLHLQSHLLAGQVQALAGAVARPSGPVPLSPAEEGLFAWLVLELLAAAPGLDGALAGTRRHATAAVRAPDVLWRVRIGEQVGLAAWKL